ncbi:MAG: cation diffusion facilitator family transporter [Pseudonocardiales bacterium]|nr:cation diffusion facilitator family transporter [Pseudonocardiales bacterium]
MRTAQVTPSHRVETAEQGSGGGESTLTVIVALAINASIAVMKAVAGVLTGSVAMLAEAAHSVADTSTEGLLLAALRHSKRPADQRHPFGYGKMRFFWSLIAAVSIFVTGAMYAVYEGMRTIFGAGEEQTLAWVAFLVLGLSFVMEGTSWIRALRQVHREQDETGQRLLEHLRTTDDPTVKTVFFEDTAALLGLLLAFAGVGLHLLTGSALWDGLASLLIGVLLAAVAYLLGRTNMRLLIGVQADARLVGAIYARLHAKPEVEQVVDLLTMLTGTDKVLLCARVDFADSLSAAELERACVRIDGELRREFTDLDEIFIEPVPRTDPALRARVANRYGSALDNPRQDSAAPPVPSRR